MRQADALRRRRQIASRRESRKRCTHFFRLAMRQHAVGYLAAIKTAAIMIGSIYDRFSDLLRDRPGPLPQQIGFEIADGGRQPIGAADMRKAPVGRLYIAKRFEADMRAQISVGVWIIGAVTLNLALPEAGPDVSVDELTDRGDPRAATGFRSWRG